MMTDGTRDTRNATFAEIGAVIEANERFAVVSHQRPDGDAIGSTVALGLGLAEIGKEVIMVNVDGVPDKLAFLPLAERVMRAEALPAEFRPQVVFVLDAADPKRIGAAVHAWLGDGVFTINIDHHVSNPGFGDLRYIDGDCPATGQIVYELFRELKMPVTPAMRDHLWVAISTDTGSFQYSNTTARTFEIGAELLRAGVNVGEISRQLYESHPYRRIELLRELLNSLKISGGGRVASWSLKRQTVDKHDLRPEDNEGLIDVIRAIEGVTVAVFFEEMGNGYVRVSCRSKDPAADVSRMCEKFGGGGHRLAAGARVSGKMEEVEKVFLETVYDGLEGKY